MEAVIEKECSALGGLFQTVIGDMKSSYPIWEDFISKAGKLQSQLRATVVAAAAFLDAFQKVADLATSSRGGTRDIGSGLTRMCMRHRSIEAKLKQFSMTFLDCLINPLQEQMEEWKRGVSTLDKDHAKEYKRARQEIKKKSSDTLKLQKKAKKGGRLSSGRGDIQPQLDSAMQDVSDKYLLLEETEKQALRKALVEERQRFCYFVTMLRPVVDEEISMLSEVTHLQAISDDLKALTSDPHKLPPASEQVILDLKGSDYHWSYQTPPSSPSTTMSRKSSMCSSLNSINSSGSGGSHSHSPSSSSSSSSHLPYHHHLHHRYRSSTLPQQTPVRLCSISSHDSGFISSQDQYTSSKSPSPMLAETQPCASSGSSEASESGPPLQSDPSSSSPPSSSSAIAAAAAQSCPADKLSNGYGHYAPPHSPAPTTNGGNVGSSSGTAFPFFPPAPSSSSSSSSSAAVSSCPSRWSRPGSALLPDYPSYCTLGPGMALSSRVPSWKDWAKPGPYDQPMVNTLRRRKDKDQAPDGGSSSSSSSYHSSPASAPAPLQAPAPPGPAAPPVGEEDLLLRARMMAAPPMGADLEAHEELALALSRGLQLDTQRSSRDSLQCSSGYSTQTNTPCCSEDTIPSQVSDYDYFSMAGDQDSDSQQQDFDKSSTIPRNSDISQSYRRMFQAKRPASTAGLPSTQGPYPGPYPPTTAGSYPGHGSYPGPYPPTHAGSYPGQGAYTGAHPPTPTGQYPGQGAYTGAYPPTPAGSYPAQGAYIGPGTYSAGPPSTPGGSYHGGYPTGQGPVIVTPGTATIRRTPSSKPNARRSGSVPGTGPIPIRTPVIPVKIPTVPDLPGFNGNGGGAGEEMPGGGRGGGGGGGRGGDDESPDSPTGLGGGVGGEAGVLPVVSWSGQASTNPPVFTPPHPHHTPLSQGPEEMGEGEGEGEGSMLNAIRRGVKLKRTLTNDRSAPRMA